MEGASDDLLDRRRWVCSSACFVDPDLVYASDTPRLNGLTVANRVHLLEPQWNPAVENQAIGRVLRLDQERKVTIIHYTVEKTIEEVSAYLGRDAGKILSVRAQTVSWLLTDLVGSRIEANTETAAGWWRVSQ